MKQNNILAKLAIITILFVLVISTVNADRYFDFTAHLAYLDGDTITYTTTTIDDFYAIGYICEQDGCSSVSGLLFDEQSSSSDVTPGDDVIRLTFPHDALYPAAASNTGYGVYFYKPGYVAWEQEMPVYGTFPDYDPWPVDTYLGKIMGCHAPVQQFDVTNDIQPNVPLVIYVDANLDSTVYSPVSDSGPLQYNPPVLEPLRDMDVRVTVRVYDWNDDVVFMDSEDIIIATSSAERVEFTWTPTVPGNYRAEVITEVTDEKCYTQREDSADKEFLVYTEDPRNACYTLLNGLSTNNQFPRAGDIVEVTATKISNYADDNYELSEVPTTATINVIRSNDNVVVHTETIELPANANPVDPAYFSFNWDTTDAATGLYEIQVMAVANDDICDGLLNPAEVQSITVELYNPSTSAPDLENLPDQVLDMNEVPPTNWVDLWAYTTDADTPVNELTYVLVDNLNEDLIDCYITDNRYFNCDAPALDQSGSTRITVEVSDGFEADRDSFTITVLGAPEAPLIANVPNVVFYQDETYSLDLDDYVTDADNEDSELTWTVDGNVNVGINIDPVTHVAIFYNINSAWYGDEIVTFTVTDPTGLSDTDNVLVRVLPLDPNDYTPTVDIITPVNGEVISGVYEVTYNAADPNGDLLYITIEYSDDNGNSWITLLDNGANTGSYMLDTTVLSGNDHMLRVSAWDGWYTGYDTVGFEIDNSPASIAPEISDIPDVQFYQTETYSLDLDDYVSDADNGKNELTWTVSGNSNVAININPITHTVVFSSVSPTWEGIEVVTFTVTDPSGLSDSEAVIVTVLEDFSPYAPVVTILAPDDREVIRGIYEVLYKAVDPNGDLLYITIEYSSDYGNTWTTLAQNVANTGSYMLDTTILPDGTGNMLKVSAWDGMYTGYDTTGLFTIDNAGSLIDDNFGLGITTINLVYGEVYQPGDSVVTYFTINNNGDSSLDNVQVTMASLDLGVRAATAKFDLSTIGSHSEMLYIEIPEDTLPGVYDIRYTFSNTDIKRTKHRSIIVE